ncbi:MAG: Na+/H+ antiporter NhaA [Pseudomonadota bacterium]
MDSLQRLLHSDRTSGVLMLAVMALALAAANSPLRPLYQAVHHAPVLLRIGPLILSEPAIGWVNEGLMVFFFLLVGLEIKREVREGMLASPRRAALALIAALGGMAFPALIYVLFTWRDPVAVHGWAIPTATDIVLALGVLAFLGDRVPAGLKVFITALAIFDDLGGVVLVGLFYGGEIARYPLAIAALAAAALAGLTWLRVARPAPFVALGLVLWVAMLKSGIPAALAGVIIAFAVPMRTRDGAASPLRALEHGLRPWVALVVIPAFAFFNAGIALDNVGLAALTAPVSLGIALGLFIGKPLGIGAATWLAVRARAGELPQGVEWRHVLAGGMVAGIGFTLSLYVAALAFDDPQLINTAKLAILAGSVVSAASGVAVLAKASRPRCAAQPTRRSAA